MNRSLIQSQFGLSAQAYALSPVHAKGVSLDQLIAAVAPQPHWCVLDIATGPGHTAFAFAPHVEKVVATDITDEMLDAGRGLRAERNITNVAFEEADAENLPYEDETFNCVTCRIAPHHFENIAFFLAEVRRVLTPDGRFGLVDNVAPDSHSTPGYTPEDLETAASDYNAFEKLRDPSHARALSFSEWMAHLDAAGLRVTHHELIEKPMEFGAWVERMGTPDDAMIELRRMIDDGTSTFRAFLRPEIADGGLHLHWTEGLFVAEKKAG